MAIEDEKDKDPWVMAILDGEEVMVTIEDKAADGGEAMLALEDKAADGEAMLALEDIPEVDRPQPDGTSAGDGWNLMEFQWEPEGPGIFWEMQRFFGESFWPFGWEPCLISFFGESCSSRISSLVATFGLWSLVATQY